VSLRRPHQVGRQRSARELVTPERWIPLVITKTTPAYQVALRAQRRGCRARLPAPRGERSARLGARASSIWAAAAGSRKRRGRGFSDRADGGPLAPIFKALNRFSAVGRLPTSIAGRGLPSCGCRVMLLSPRCPPAMDASLTPRQAGMLEAITASRRQAAAFAP
jgi:hypothetical protein